MKQTLQLGQRQRLNLAPGVRQGLSVLRLPAVDLLDLIAREAAENPFLIVEDRRRAVSAIAGIDVALDTVAAQPSMVERLFRQIGLMTLAPATQALALHLVGELREDGYLDVPLQEIAAELSVPLEALEAALSVLQQCDPAGVGARSLAECLELQLRDVGLDKALAQAVVARIDQFSTAQPEKLARALGVSLTRLREIAAMVSGLRAKPVTPDDTPAAPLLPDLVLEKDANGTFRVTSRSAVLPHVRLNTALLVQAAAQDFGAAAQARAQMLVQALAFRGSTLLRIGERIAHHQHRALRDGPDGLVPLTRATIAGDLGLHPSTVSRAVAGKALEVDGRLWPLERFFSHALPVAGAESVSAFVVQRSIARLIAAEPEGAPLSDLRLSEMLHAEGVDISRRTVAKYRICLRIPPSHERRRQKNRRPTGSATGRSARH